MTEKTFIDEVMGFDPAAAVTAFEATTEKYVNQNIYKTNPANSTSEDGHYHSKVRVLLNPFNIKRNIIHQARYSMKDEKGFFQVISSLSDGDKNCPIFKAWKQLWFSKMQDPTDPTNSLPDEAKKAWARQKFDKSETDWALVQIIEDDNQPDLVGSIKVMKLPKAIMNRLLSKMNPTDAKKQKQPLMDYIFGAILEMDVTPGPDDPAHPERKQREISYDLCDFETDPTPIIKTDGTQLFTDEELELIEDYNSANNDLFKAKSQAKRDEAAAKKEKLAPQIRPLYAKAIEYLKGVAIDPVVECGYSAWSEETTKRVNAWIEKVVAMEDPELGSIFSGSTSKAETTTEQPMYSTSVTASNDDNGDNDLPF